LLKKKKMKQIIVLAIAMMAMTCSASAERIFGEGVDIGDATGQIRMYVDVHDNTRFVEAIGVEYPRSVIDTVESSEPFPPEKFFCHGEGEDEVCLPDRPARLYAPDVDENNIKGLLHHWVVVNYNAFGHAPEGVWNVAHFDNHFYVQDADVIWDELIPGSCLELCDCEAAKKALAPVNDDHFPRGDDWLWTGDIGCVPRMGDHYISPSLFAEFELGSDAFKQTLLWGRYNGLVSFHDLMVTLAYIKSAPTFKECHLFEQPTRYERGGAWPTRQCVEATDSAVYVSLDRTIIVDDNDSSANALVGSSMLFLFTLFALLL
jgi:hypothetical protein